MIDIGANLTSISFDHDVDVVICEAQSVGVTNIIVSGSDEADSKAAIELAQRFPGFLYSTAGVHPHLAAKCNEQTIDTLRKLAENRSVVALGECGLDFNRNYSPPKQQEYWFEKQLELAVELKMPVFLHQRDAHVAFIEILSRYRDQLVDAVVHCFTGNKDELLAYLEMDLHIGITGWICDERRGQHLLELVPLISQHRLMIETDAPYLLPRTLSPKPKSRRNEPKYLLHICETVAKCIDLEFKETSLLTSATARKFFRLA